MDKMKCETESGVERNVDKIAAMFPQVVTEVKGEDGKIRRAVKWDVLKELLSGEYVEGGECYDFTWPGKRAAIAEAAKSIRKTLRPCKAESKDWDTTENLYIEGDNLEVLKLLQESYLGKVKMIYIDPPYNTGNDFVYRDDFKVGSGEWAVDSGELFEDEETGETNRMFRNTESNGRFHSDWCSMIYSRLVLARDLLSEDGAIFISIDDNEVENLKKICDEIFGANNFIAQIIWKSKSGGANDSEFFAVDHEYILIYANSKKSFALNKDLEATVTTVYNRKDENGEYALDRLDKQSIRYSASLDYEIIGPDGSSYFPKHKDPAHPNASWRWSQEHVRSHYNELVFENGCVYTKNYKKDGSIARSLLLEDRFGRTRTGKTDCFDLFNTNIFSNPKPYKLIRFLEMIASDKNAIVLDFFSGSATTAHATLQLNSEDGGTRKFIMVQFPEALNDQTAEGRNAIKFCEEHGFEKNLCSIGKERIRRAGEKIKEEAGLAAADLDVGFRVFKLDDSNMKDVYYSADEYKQKTLDELISNIKEDRTNLDLLYGCLLEWGVELSLPHTSEKIDGVTVHTVNNGDLIACFDANIPESAIRAIAKRQPLRAVFRDSSFASAPQKINVEEIFKLLSPATTVKVI